MDHLGFWRQPPERGVHILKRYLWRTEQMLSISKALQNWKEASILQVLQGCMAESTLAQHLWGGEGLCV